MKKLLLLAALLPLALFAAKPTKMVDENGTTTTIAEYVGTTVSNSAVLDAEAGADVGIYSATQVTVGGPLQNNTLVVDDDGVTVTGWMELTGDPVRDQGVGNQGYNDDRYIAQSGTLTNSAEIVAEASGYTNRVERISADGRHWYGSPFAAFADAQDGDSFVVHPGTYNELGSQTSHFGARNNIRVAGIGRPRINITLPNLVPNERGLDASYMTNFIMTGIDFYQSTTGDVASLDSRYGLVLSRSSNAVVEDCRYQWDMSENNSSGAKMVVAVAEASGVVFRGCGFVLRDLGSNNSAGMLATHDAGALPPVFDDCTFVYDGIDYFDVGSLSILDACTANDLALFPASAGAQDDERPFLAGVGEINGAMIVGSMDDLSVQTGRNALRTELSRNPNVIVVGDNLDEIVGVQGPDFDCIPSDFSGTIFVQTSSLINKTMYPDDNVTQRYVFQAGTTTSYNTAVYQFIWTWRSASNINITVEGGRFHASGAGDNFGLTLHTCTNSSLTVVDCEFAHVDTLNKRQCVYQSGVGNQTYQMGGRVMTTGQDWIYYYGHVADGVAVYTNGTFLAAPDYIKWDTP